MDLLVELRCTGTAAVVFESEHGRDEAICRLGQSSAPLFRGQHRITAHREKAEPRTVVWENFSVTSNQLVVRLAAGVVIVIIAVLLWGLLFYSPFAYFETTTFRMLGEPPSMAAELTFTLFVAIGNQIMYVLCSIISQEVGFKTSDQMQACYLILYTSAVLVNTIVDVAVVCVTSYFSMVAQGVRTREGIRLDALP